MVIRHVSTMSCRMGVLHPSILDIHLCFANNLEMIHSTFMKRIIITLYLLLNQSCSSHSGKQIKN